MIFVVYSYGNVVASGKDCVAPSMDPQTFNEVRYENVEVEDVERDDDLDGNQDGNKCIIILLLGLKSQKMRYWFLWKFHR